MANDSRIPAAATIFELRYVVVSAVMAKAKLAAAGAASHVPGLHAVGDNVLPWLKAAGDFLDSTMCLSLTYRLIGCRRLTGQRP